MRTHWDIKHVILIYSLLAAIGLSGCRDDGAKNFYDNLNTRQGGGVHLTDEH